MKYFFTLLFILFISITGCDFPANSPPLYQTRARDFLEQKGIEKNLIKRLIGREQLTGEELDLLSGFDNIAVLHLLASNPGIPITLIEQFSKHKSFEVHTGIASNPRTPLKLLKKLRTPGRYTTVNDYLARNPNMPEELLWEMHLNKEVSFTNLALNPNCPHELMAKIANEGSEVDRAWLATNPSLPNKIIAQLKHDNSEIVQGRLKRNPNYREQVEGTGSRNTR